MRRNGKKSVQALHAGAMKALRRAVTKAISEHESAGVPAAVWRNGKVMYLSGKHSQARRDR